MGVPFDPAQVVFTQLDTLKVLTITIDDALFKSNTPPPPPKYKYVYHVVKKGESLSVIARQYRVSVAYICKMNRITAKTILRPGRTLRIR
jgi:LysM repeat protein